MMLSLISRIRTSPVSQLTRTFSQSSAVLSSSGPKPYREEQIVVTEDKTVIACWHPPPKFPYEMSRPIPREDSAGVTSPLKVQ